MSKQYINPAPLFASLKFGFSQIVTVQGGRTVYLSGQTPFNAEEKVVGVNRREQMQQCLKNVKTALEAVGGSLSDVVSLRIYMVNYNPDAEVNAIAQGLKEFFPGEHPPATTWIGISSLALKEFLIEIEAVAVVK
ncbi:RidA family protein [Gloeocapsopsis dulcis]|nr:RidA family protein [Gloeocapsopsis dulcis]WNN89406.1 RidA family protein [Gloeocapsopsis dulcis]